MHCGIRYFSLLSIIGMLFIREKNEKEENCLLSADRSFDVCFVFDSSSSSSSFSFMTR